MDLDVRDSVVYLKQLWKLQRFILVRLLICTGRRENRIVISFVIKGMKDSLSFIC